MNDQAQSFKLAIYKLMEQHPLYDYRIRSGRKFRLPVLLIGSGEKLNVLRDTILSLGQLLDTQLKVICASPDKQRAGQALVQQAPDLARFIRIEGISQVPDCQWDLGTLAFESCASAADVLANHPECRYVILSQDIPLPKDLKPSPRQMIARIEEDGIRIFGKKDTLLSPMQKDSCLEDLEKIAYALHVSYEKGNDPKVTEQEMRDSFRILYNYESNIECALHIRSKIKCAGIDPSSLNIAAEEFAQKLEEDAEKSGGVLLENLARLEHQRWCISKLLQGFRLGSPDQCYSAPGVATHDKKRKWHIALVPYGKNGVSCRRLTDPDWNVSDPESLSDLDALDKQTLWVHKQCGVLAMQRQADCLAAAEMLIQCLDEPTRASAQSMAEALERMYLGHRKAADDYRHHLRALNRRLPAPSPAVQEILDMLKFQTAPILEYLARKDYKQQNFVLVSRIPFALSHWKKTVLVKLMADRVQDCVRSVWQLEPSKACFVDIAETAEELMQLREQAIQIDSFLCTYSTTSPSFHIFVPEKLKSKLQPGPEGELDMAHDAIVLDLKGNLDWHIYPRASVQVHDIRPKFVELLHESGATAIDMTGGKPELITVADGLARNSRVGAFFIRSDTLHNYYGARGMANQLLDRGLSVEELFAQTGAEKIKQDSEFVSGIFREQCPKLWAIAFSTDLWYRFCQAVSKAQRKQTGLRIDKNKLDNAIIEEARLCAQHVKGAQEKKAKEQEATAHLKDILTRLCHAGVLQPDSQYYRVSCDEALWAISNAGKALEYYIYCTASGSSRFKSVAMSWFFRHSGEKDAAANELDVVCTLDTASLFISAKHVSLNTIKNNNFLNYVCYEVGWLADRFGGLNPRTVLAAPRVPQFEKDGSVSKLVVRAMERGVYLLGDACFREGCLAPVLEAIAAETPDPQNKLRWCDVIPRPAAV